MGSSVLWLFALTGVYWAYCLYWGVAGYFRARTASDYFIAGRQIPMWVFVLAATATSFSGWTFVGHPALVWRDGLPYAFAAFYVITIPLTGTLFLKRQWMLGKRFGYVTPGEMYADYYGSEAMRLLTVVVALFFSVPYLGLQLKASGVLFHVLSGQAVPVEFGMWALSAVVFAYVCLGGLRSVAYVDTAQCLLLVAGIVAMGLIAVIYCGGLGPLLESFRQMVAEDLASGSDALGLAGVRTPAGDHRLVAVPGAIQWVRSGDHAVGGLWTGTMILTYMFALMGVQASPAFSMWAFSTANPRPFAPQQVWASALGVGACLFVFSALQGLGGWGLLRSGALSLEHLRPPHQENLVPELLRLVEGAAPALVGLVALGALAAMQSTGSAYMATAGGMLTRDLYVRFLNPRASAAQQKFWGRAGVAGVALAALLVATFSTEAIVLLGGLAVSYGTQMWLPLLGLCYWPWLTRQGVTAGLVAGLAAVTLTGPIRHGFLLAVQEGLGIGAYPLTIHCAGWGILANGAVAVVVSAATQPDRAEYGRRLAYHRFLRLQACIPSHKAHLKPWAWGLGAAWFACAVGPLAVLGNDFFFFEASDPGTWPLGVPPLWLWQGAWWGVGVFFLWFLAYGLGFSTHFGDVRGLRDDIATTYWEKAPVRLDVERPGA